MDKSRLRPFGIFFEKSLNDLIRGIRKRRDPDVLSEYLRRVISECREEVRQPDMDIKAMAVLKLAYLEMYGFDVAWAGFHILEVMSSPKFQQKRIGYLAAMQIFRNDTELLMLATNLLKTDLASSALQRVAISLSGLANIVTPFLAIDISDDIIKMLNHSQPYIRKKAILAMYKVILQYPEALQATIPRLHAKLDDEDTSVVSAAVNVICELTNRTSNPRPFIELAPTLYDILTTSKNNWCLIKILKLFSNFTVHEPRLKPKVLPHIVHLMETTEALSLLYECISCILRGNMLEPDDYPLARSCVSKLRMLIEERDQNLKFVSLEALSLAAKINPAFLADDHEIILPCINDTDTSIRLKVLDLLVHIVNEDNLYDIVTQLMEQMRGQGSLHIAASEYDVHVVAAIINLCSVRNYEYVPNFEWYIETLVELEMLCYASVPSAGELVGFQLQNVVVRVKSMRSVAVNACINLTLNTHVATKQPQLLSYTLWTIGEYIGEYLDAANVGTTPELIKSLFAVPTSPAAISCITKIFSKWIQRLPFWSDTMASSVQECITGIVTYLSKLTTSVDAETQERAVQFLELFKLGSEALEEHSHDSGDPPALLTVAFPALFEEFDITPVAPNAQLRIQVPAELDVDTPISIMDVVLSESEQETSEPDTPVELKNEQTPPRDPALDPYYIPTSRTSSGTRGSSVSRQDLLEFDSQESDKTPSNPVNQSFRPKKIQRVKVEIAQDEPMDGGVDYEDAAALKAAKKPLFLVRNRLNALDLNAYSGNTDTEAGQESQANHVQVKHKKLDRAKRKKKPKSSHTVT